MWEIKPERQTELEPSPKRSNLWIWLVLIIVFLAGIGFGLWRWISLSKVSPEGTGAPAQADAGSFTPDGGTVSTEQIADGEAILRQLGPTLSTAPELQTWLAQQGLIRRLASAINLIADGDSPGEVLGFLAPKGKFEVSEGRQLFTSPRSYARYDLVTRVITSIDVSAAGKAYRAVAPFLRSAYAEVGRPAKTFETALREALDRMINTPIPESEPELKEKGATYLFADPKLEGLTPAQKHLLRMGPTNARAMQRWLAAIHKELFPSP